MFLELCLASALAAPPKVAPGPRASSEAVSSDGEKHPASLAFDGLLSTHWAEGAQGEGTGEWLELRFDRPTDVYNVSLFPGFLGGSDREIREYGRPRLVTVTLEVPGQDPVTKQERLLDPGSEGPLRQDVVVSAVGATSLRVTIDEAFAGGLFGETAIAEVAVNFTGGDVPPGVEEVRTWLASPPGQKAADAQRDEVIARFDAISEAQFGDRDRFEVLLDHAADGAPFLREKVARLPYGFRMHPLQPDKTSIEALLKLKDSNAIPAIERASLRVTGTLAEDLKRRARLFVAYSELLGANVRNLPPWGKEGIARGALRGFGAPMDVVADTWGHVYVADTANHRVQQFSVESGVVERVYGSPEPGVTEVWYAGTRDAYGSGAEPGEDPGEFVHPTSLATVPGRDGDTLFVLDARGRLTEIGAAGNIERVVSVPSDGGIGPTEGHVVADRKQVVVLLGGDGFVYDRKAWGDPVTFTIAEGSASGAVLLSSSKLGLIFDHHLVMYSLDGFRHGELLGDTLGGGFQDWDVTLDERGKLWAVLDTGVVIKYKSPGRVDFQVKVGEYSFDVPRLAVLDDHVFVSENDRILHVDALQALEQGSATPGAGNLEVEE